MFNRDGIFGKKEDNMRKDNRNVNLTPSLQTPPPAGRTSPPDTPSKPEPQIQEPAKPVVASEEGQGSKLIVGPDIKLKGVEITDCDTLVVEGRVEASMDSRVIKIAQHGVFAGTVGIDVAEIRGLFDGNLTVRQKLVIYATGKVTGKVRYGKVVIEEGGQLSGEIEAGISGAGARPAGARPLQPVQ